MRFAQALQGKGPRHPKAVRPAFLLLGAAVAYSTAFYPRPDLVQTAAVAYSGYFYPQVRPGPVRAAQTVTPIWRVAEETITVKAIRGQEGPNAEARFLWAVRYLLAIANGEPIQ